MVHFCDFYRRDICVFRSADHNYRLWWFDCDNHLYPGCIWHRVSPGRICTEHAGGFSIRDCQRGLSVALVFPLLSLLVYEINPGSSVYDPTVLLMIVLLGIAT